MGKVASFLGGATKTIGKTVSSPGFVQGALQTAAPLVRDGLRVGSDLAAASSAKAIAKQNAELLEIEAEETQRAAEEEAIRQLRITKERVAEGKVAFAGGGVVASVGTPLLSAMDEAKRGMDRANVALQEGVDASQNLRRQAGFELLEGKTVSRARKISAGATVLGSVAQAIGKKKGYEETIED